MSKHNAMRDVANVHESSMGLSQGLTVSSHVSPTCNTNVLSDMIYSIEETQQTVML